MRSGSPGQPLFRKAFLGSWKQFSFNDDHNGAWCHDQLPQLIRSNLLNLLIVHCEVLADENTAVRWPRFQEMIRNPPGRAVATAKDRDLVRIRELVIVARIFLVDAYDASIRPVKSNACKCRLKQS